MINWFARNKHLAKEREGVVKERKRRKAYKEAVVEKCGLAIGKGEYEGGFHHLATFGVGRDEFGSYEVVV